MIDSNIFRAHQHSAGAVKKDKDSAIGQSRAANRHDEITALYPEADVF